jgi:hypothetical protein
MKTSAPVLVAHSKVPAIGWKLGVPLKTISSVGTWLTYSVGTPLASDGFGLAFGPPSSMSTSPAAASFLATSSMPMGARLAWLQGPSRELADNQPSYTCRYQLSPRPPCSISARVLMTRLKRESSGTGLMTGAPSIGTRMAGVLLTMMRGGSFSTGKLGAFTPAAFSEASTRSSEMVRVAAPSLALSSAA